MFDLTPLQAEEIRHQQVKMLYQRFNQALIATVINSILITVALWQEIAHTTLIIWLVALLTVTALRQRLNRQYLRRQPAAAQAPKWESRFFLGVAASAVLWSSAGLVLFAHHSVVHQVFLAFVLGGMSVGAITSLSSRWPLVLLFILLTEIPITAQFLSSGDQVLAVMGIMYAVFFVLILKLALDYHHNTRENITLQVLSTDRARQLEVAKQKAEQASRAKSDFLSQMSHELRTPLNAIMGFAQLLQLNEKNDAGDSQQQQQRDRAVREILIAGDYLTRLVEDVLDLGAIDKQRMQVQLEPVEAETLVRDCIGLLAPLAQQHGVSLTVKECPGTVMADPVRARQVLLNLIGNAIKYNGEDGSVTVHTHYLSDHQVRFNVADTGPGIAAGALEHLFDSFERFGTSKSKGIGIGLSIAKSLTELMGGSIGVKSSEGRGSTFWIDLPATTSHY